MGAMQELIDERLAPQPHGCRWVVCFTHKKRLQHCVWQRMKVFPSEAERVVQKPCDQCLSEETSHDTDTLSLFDSHSSAYN